MSVEDRKEAFGPILDLGKYPRERSIERQEDDAFFCFKCVLLDIYVCLSM